MKKEISIHPSTRDNTTAFLIRNYSAGLAIDMFLTADEVREVVQQLARCVGVRASIEGGLVVLSPDSALDQAGRERRLLLRAHDLICGQVQDRSWCDYSDLRKDIRAALKLEVTDCDWCHACLAKADAKTIDGCDYCATCAEFGEPTI